MLLIKSKYYFSIFEKMWGIWKGQQRQESQKRIWPKTISEWACLHWVNYVIDQIPDKHHCLRKLFFFAQNVKFVLNFEFVSKKSGV